MRTTRFCPAAPSQPPAASHTYLGPYCPPRVVRGRPPRRWHPKGRALSGGAPSGAPGPSARSFARRTDWRCGPGTRCARSDAGVCSNHSLLRGAWAVGRWAPVPAASSPGWLPSFATMDHASYPGRLGHQVRSNESACPGPGRRTRGLEGAEPVKVLGGSRLQSATSATSRGATETWAPTGDPVTACRKGIRSACYACTHTREHTRAPPPAPSRQIRADGVLRRKIRRS